MRFIEIRENASAPKFTRDQAGIYRLGEWWIWPDIGGRVGADQMNPARIHRWVVGRGDEEIDALGDDRIFKKLVDAQAYVMGQF